MNNHVGGCVSSVFILQLGAFYEVAPTNGQNYFYFSALKTVIEIRAHFIEGGVSPRRFGSLRY